MKQQTVRAAMASDALAMNACNSTEEYQKNHLHLHSSCLWEIRHLSPAVLDTATLDTDCPNP